MYKQHLNALHRDNNDKTMKPKQLKRIENLKI